MRREREELLDFVLGEGPAPLERDPAAEAELLDVLLLVRLAAAEGWGVRGQAAPRGARAGVRWLRPALAAAAVFLVALLAYLLNGAAPKAVYEPDVALGPLLAEETDANGMAPGAPPVPAPTMRLGKATFSPLGGARNDVLRPGEEVPLESELRTPADTGARIDLPNGAIVFVGPLSTVRLRKHDAGGPAVRLVEGVAATVAGGEPIHLAVQETDLLLRQESGALLVRQMPGEAIVLRGVADLLLAGGGRFRIPAGDRLPAACVREPFSTPATATEMDLEWYLALQHGGGSLVDVPWERAGRSEPLHVEPGTIVYLRLESASNARCEVSFGGEPRVFELDADKPLSVRLRLDDLGPGPRLSVSPTPTSARLLKVNR
ncbi:MAG TPA: hypothetical protein VFY93_02790 [Planctomycetota bacterium]|nr:hypothetical protein [Planctomycetota bacterium]